MFLDAPPSIPMSGAPPVALLLDRLAQVTSRPRYSFMLLTLIAEVADERGRAGPFVRPGRGEGAAEKVAQGPVLLRDWLSDSLTPMAKRDPRRLALAERVADELRREGRLPDDAGAARALIDAEVRERVRGSGKANLSRAISELVCAGLIRRHYEGYRVDHVNRGAQRHAVYTLTGLARGLMRGTMAPALPARGARQGELALG